MSKAKSRNTTAWTTLDGESKGTSKQLVGQVVYCEHCGTNTWAKSADSGTLAKWQVKEYPGHMLCPDCVKAGHKLR